MEHPQLPNNGIEHRFAPADFETRQEGEKTRFKGYALRFGVTYDMGWFTEEVDKRALENADLKDVRILLNHDPSQILGRTQAGTAVVGVDDIGLWYDFAPPESPNGENARVAISRGDITQSSWGFRLRQDATGRRTGDRWEMRNGKEHRTLTDVSEVLDASPVTFPANPDTSVAKRCRDAAMGMQVSVGDAMNVDGQIVRLSTAGTTATYTGLHDSAITTTGTLSNSGATLTIIGATTSQNPPLEISGEALRGLIGHLEQKPPAPDAGITETLNRLTRALDRKLAIQTKHK